MLSLAIEAHDELAMDTREVTRQGPSYSVLTMAEVRQEIGPVKPLIWCMGMDAFAGLKQWHRWQELLNYGHVLVLTRPATSWPQDPELLTWYATHKVDEAKHLVGFTIWSGGPPEIRATSRICNTDTAAAAPRS